MTWRLSGGICFSNTSFDNCTFVCTAPPNLCFGEIQIGCGKFHFIGQWNEIFIIATEEIAMHFGHFIQKFFGFLLIFLYQTRQGVKAIEEEVWIDLALQSEDFTTLICVFKFFTFRKGIFPVFPVGHPFIDKGDYRTHDTSIKDRPPEHFRFWDASKEDHMGKNVKCAKYSADIHKIKKWQHEPDSLKQIACPGIPVFDEHSYRSEYAIDDKKVNCTREETLDKTGKRTKNAGTKNEEVHKQDIGRYDPCKNQWFLTTVPLY